MKLLIDTNVILDVLLKREGFYEDSAKILKLAGDSEYHLFVSASAVTDIYYISRKVLSDRKSAIEKLQTLFEIVSIAAVSEDEIKNAIKAEWKDFEDSVQYSVALIQKLDGIVTRNKSDYEENSVTVYEPVELLNSIKE